MRLRFGMIGGGNNGSIGVRHKQAATVYELSQLVCGCFSRDRKKSLMTAQKWGIENNERVYEDYSIMAEKESKLADGIDFVVVVTPNNSHYDIVKKFLLCGINVMCDKPLSLSSLRSKELVDLAKEKGVLLAVAYTYTGYPAIKQARELIDNGDIGNIHTILAEYPQDWMATLLNQSDGSLNIWRQDPNVAGPSGCATDIGTHLECLINKMTGLRIKRVIAKLEKKPSCLKLESNLQALLTFNNGASGQMWASQIAIGNEIDISVRIIGDKGSIVWKHNNYSRLKVTKVGEPAMYCSASKHYYSGCKDGINKPAASNYEGIMFAMANIYREFCLAIMSKKRGANCSKFHFPNGEDGYYGNRFVEACIKSNENNNIWIEL